jgi:hypothetical protein
VPAVLALAVLAAAWPPRRLVSAPRLARGIDSLDAAPPSVI